MFPRFGVDAPVEQQWQSSSSSRSNRRNNQANSQAVVRVLVGFFFDMTTSRFVRDC